MVRGGREGSDVLDQENLHATRQITGMFILEGGVYVIGRFGLDGVEMKCQNHLHYGTGRLCYGLCKRE